MYQIFRKIYAFADFRIGGFSPAFNKKNTSCAAIKNQFVLNSIAIIAMLFALAPAVFADGLLMPTAEGYPKDFLKNRSTEVSVIIHGIIAETIVTQEFVNEWHDSTDAVYSFPLPPEARATSFVYWYKDIAYKAVLKVKEQAVNPGTGEGGIVAEVNKYIGRNGIKVFLKGIQPGQIQRTRLHYISLCDYYQGKCSYEFPLNTQDFVKRPLEHLQFSVEVHSNSEITSFAIPSHPDFKMKQNEPYLLKLEMIKPKAYLNANFEFHYQTAQSELGVDFYSVDNDSSEPGHFGLILRPPNEAPPDSIIPRRILFLLSNSNSMSGYRLTQSISAISRSLDQLSSHDLFNIILFNNSVQPWKSAPIPASVANIQSAKTYLSAISANWGSQMDLGLKECLRQITDASFSNAILVFTSGYSPLDPRQIEALNTYKTGIFPIGIGDELDRARLEMTAALNYGFVTYIDANDNLNEKMFQVFQQISQPILTDVGFEYGRADLSQIMPQKIRSTYAGSYFFNCGRYQNPGYSALSIAGNSLTGLRYYNFRLDFSDTAERFKFVRSLWAKEMIDALEWEIEIYEETEALKQQLIDLSLQYNIRCRYTAYIADYQTEDDYTPIEVNVDEPLAAMPATSCLVGNFPNPFNPSTTIRLFIEEQAAGKVKLLKVFDILGRLVAVIDVSQFAAGWHEVKFTGKDLFGADLPSGIYFVRLQVQNQLSGALRICLIR